MAEQRSPNYPGVGLPSAKAALEKLWAAEKRTPVSHEVAVKAMGYKTLSGPARVAIGTLRQYGLIEKTEKNHIRVSDLGIKLMLGEPTEKASALAEAANNPGLFRELAQTHADASENAIRAYLITKKGFIDDGARKAAKAFKETLGLVRGDTSGYADDHEPDNDEAMVGSQSGQPQGTGTPAKPADGVFSLSVPFAKGSINVQVRVVGDAISPAHLARVRKYLELAESEWDDGE